MCVCLRVLVDGAVDIVFEEEMQTCIDVCIYKQVSAHIVAYTYTQPYINITISIKLLSVCCK